jgi:hypothetical protein
MKIVQDYESVNISKGEQVIQIASDTTKNCILQIRNHFLVVNL